MDAVRHLLELSKGNTLVSTATGNIVTPVNFTKAWRQICNNAGVEHRSPHTLRHIFATDLFYAGADVKTVSSLLGHSTTQITYDTYIHVIQDKKDDAVKLFETKPQETKD